IRLLREIPFGDLSRFYEGEGYQLARLSPDGSWVLLAGSYRRSVSEAHDQRKGLWAFPIPEGTPVAHKPTLSHNLNLPHDIRFTGTDSHVAIGDRYVWDPVTDRDVAVIPKQDPGPQYRHVSPDGRWRAKGDRYWKKGEEHEARPLPGAARTF